MRMRRPHVVLLGAGASRAACPDGDKNGKMLPLMRDLAETREIKPMLQGWGIDPAQNFEDVFSDLHEKNETEKLRRIERMVEGYFSRLALPEEPTLYDHLVLSLRGKDLIATFNWDPLLVQAYARNRNTGLEMPRLLFLHGNVGIHYCEQDKKIGMHGTVCNTCGKTTKRIPLLYPIKQKDYARDRVISWMWDSLKKGLRNAFMLTVFGYSAPRTDMEAIGLMKAGWGDKNIRYMEQTEFITSPRQDEEAVVESWKDFIHSHHYDTYHDFYDSSMANYPRRTGEAYVKENMDAEVADVNPIPRDLGFTELWEWFSQFKGAEDESKGDG